MKEDEMSSAYEMLKKNGPLDDAELLDLREFEGRYYFRIKGGDVGFWDALDAVKSAFHPRVRRYNKEKKEWSVPAEEESEDKLCVIFKNASNAFTVLHSQLRMF